MKSVDSEIAFDIQFERFKIKTCLGRLETGTPPSTSGIQANNGRRVRSHDHYVVTGRTRHRVLILSIETIDMLLAPVENCVGITH
jgi:hypothetical protein